MNETIESWIKDLESEKKKDYNVTTIVPEGKCTAFINQVSTILHFKSLLELTPEHIKITLKTKKDHQIQISLPIHGIDGYDTCVVFTMFKGDDLIVADWNELEHTVKGFINYLTT